MRVYEVVDVQSGNAWTSKFGGEMQDYRLTLRNPDGREKPGITLAQRKETAPPSPGQSLELTVEADGQGRLKAKKVQPPLGARGGFSGPRPVDPKQQASIIRCHAQKCATDLMIAAGKTTADDFTRDQLRQWVDFLCADVEAYVQKAGQS